MNLPATETVAFEAVVPADAGTSMFHTELPVSAMDIAGLTPSPQRRAAAARALQARGFRVRHIGTFSISAEGPRGLWEQTFGTRVEQRTQPRLAAHPEAGETSYWSHIAGVPFSVPTDLESLVERAYPQRPPTLLQQPSPLPPRVAYHHLRVPDDVATVLRATAVHEHGITGRGVLVAIVDTGFYPHPFHIWHGYKYQGTPAPDSSSPEDDPIGHGTAQTSNVFACAGDCDLVGIKMGDNPTLGFKVASDLRPAVMTLSWGFDVAGVSTVPNYLRPLEAAVLQAVQGRNITVCCSAGNGEVAFPACMPDVIAAGGAFAHPEVEGGDFVLEASNYASSFDSAIYPGRHVPDVCGLVGMGPRSVYIMMPVPAGSDMDVGFAAGGTYPVSDETTASDGWAVASGTSSASPQVAGVCALLKQAQHDLSPERLKAILKASARSVVRGQSALGQAAGPGVDGACGAGLVDAFAAYRLTGSYARR